MDYKIAVLIPTKNRKALLQRALTSVVTQDVLPDEIIVVNDGSQDDTMDFLNDFVVLNQAVTFQVINKKESGGVNVARNDGIKISQSDWIAFLDDDDEFLPGVLSRMKSVIDRTSPDINVIYFNSIINNGHTQMCGGFQFLEGQLEYKPTYEETMMKFNLVGDCKPVFRKSLFDNHLYRFPETVNGYESYTMNLIARDNRGIKYVNEISTLIHFDNTHPHLSHSAPRKNPKPLLDLHIKQLAEHKVFYDNHLKLLQDKYISICKLALRSYQIFTLLRYGSALFLCKFKT